MIELVRMKFGSHLYGTETPSSNLDFKAVFLPSRSDILLGRVKESINVNTKTGSFDFDRRNNFETKPRSNT